MARPRESSDQSVLQTLGWLAKQGFKAVPLHYQSKAALSRDYVSTSYVSPSDDLWRNNNYGVGVVTGPQQGGPVDVDLDCPEAVHFAPVFLPPTAAVFGRKSKPKSHYLYRIDASAFDKQAFNDPVTRATIVEMRGDGGHQTVAPGSLHEATGELVQWSSVPFPDVAQVTTDVLARAVRKIAIATLIVRYMWEPGYRNEPTKHLTGLLFYLEWTLDEVIQLIEAVMDYSGDDDKSRIPTVKATFRRGEAGKKITGAGVLRKQLNNDLVVDKLLELAGSESVNLLNEYNERYAVVSLKGKFRIADVAVDPGEPPTFFQKDDWINITAVDYSDIKDDKGRAVPKNKVWITNPRRRQYRSVEFMPGVEDHASVLNLWTGWAIQPKPGDCTGWLELLRDVICGGDADLNRWMLHWFANILRDPQYKSGTCPVLIGVEGAGKSLIINYFGRILGGGFTTVTKEEHIHGQFNAHMGNCLLLHSEEALYGGDQKHAGIIRSLITDETHMFEQKGIDAQKVRNYLRLILTSNKSHAAPVAAGDRRYTVIQMKDRMASDALIKKVGAEKDGDGPAALFDYLMRMDYDPALARTNVKSADLLDMKYVNMDAFESWWQETLMTGVLLPDYLSWCAQPAKEDWPAVVSSRAMVVAMTIALRDRGVRNMPSEAKMNLQLEKMTGARFVRYQRTYANPLIDEAPPMAKSLSARQSSITNFPSLEDCRAAFEKHLGQVITWPGDEEKKPAGPKQPHEKF